MPSDSVPFPSPAAEAAAARDPVRHAPLLAAMGQKLQTRSEDEVLPWLMDQLLLSPAEHQQRVQLCHDLQVRTIRTVLDTHRR